MRKITLTGAVALLALTASAAPGFAQVPVMDTAVISASNQIAANTAEQLKRLNDIKNTTDEILESLGSQGQGQYDLNKNKDWKAFAGGGELLKALEQYGPNTCAIAGCAAGAKSADFKDLKSARSFIMKNLYSSTVASRADERDYTQARKNAEREANVSGYALSLIARQYLADAAKRAEKLDGLVNAADDVRADLRANSAVTLVQHSELTGMLAILTSMLERDATSFLAQQEREYVDKAGGTTPPDVYNEKDYLPDGTRVGVNGSGQSTTGNGSGSLQDEINQVGGSPFKAAAENSGNAQVAGQFDQAKSTYGNNNAAVALGAAAGAAGLDGDSATQAALGSAAASASSGGDLGSALFDSASNIANQSSNDDLKWMYQSADYGLDSGNWNDAVDVATGQRPMIDVMFDVAGNMASNSNVPGSYEALDQARQAYENGTIDAQEAAMEALRVASDASGHQELSGLLDGVSDLASGASAKDAIINVIRRFRRCRVESRKRRRRPDVLDLVRGSRWLAPRFIACMPCSARRWSGCSGWSLWRSLSSCCPDLARRRRPARARGRAGWSSSAAASRRARSRMLATRRSLTRSSRTSRKPTSCTASRCLGLIRRAA